MSDPRVLVLGGGPAGVGAAYRLRRENRAQVTVIEKAERVGGNAGSFEISGQAVDYGSHRLHPACDPEVLADIKQLLGSDLIERPRHGRIRLGSRWIHFPLRPLDLLLHAERSFAIGVTRDILARRWSDDQVDGEESFATVLRGKLGKSICEQFYFPYARKIWGREPEELSEIQARRRVSADSFAKLLRKVLGRLPGVRPLGFRHFLYPRRGYGQISEAFAKAATSLGADVALGWRVERVSAPAGPGEPYRVVAVRNGETRTFEGDYLWSTIPITVLARIFSPTVPTPVLEAAERLQFRAMLLVYLALETNRYSEYDAHYFPGSDVRLTRLSEPKNYVGDGEPTARTTLCAEIPCSTADSLWALSDAQLGTLVADDLARTGIALPVSPSEVVIRRLPQAYPIYLRGYERWFAALDRWAEEVPRLLTFGRQGLFAHDNTHHALHMAYCAARCLSDGKFDGDEWDKYRAAFESHVVED